MLLYNTLTEKKEELAKPTSGALKMFVCGPTVYDYPHIGNGRTYVTYDMFARYLRSRGMDVIYLQNITDVDDKIIARAKEEQTTPKAIAKKFEKIYHANEKALGITGVTKYARATGYIPEIVKQVQTLIEKGCAYKIEGDGYYFDITRFADYGKLAKRTIEQAEDGVSRIDESIKKRNKGDFALWKFSKTADEPAWETSLGSGRPGWHIEDTAITEHFFGPQYDIHGGGVDLKFPHHEAEIAQQESASEKKPMVKIWMHAGFLLVNGEKMSKSKGNFISIEDFLTNHSAQTFRWMVASHHYRSPMDYTDALAAQTESAIRGIREFFAKLALVSVKSATTTSRDSFTTDLSDAEHAFIAALDDDFNTPGALAAAFALMNRYEPMLWRLSKTDAKAIAATLKKCFAMLGLEFKPEKIPAKITALAKKREVLRAKKDFTGADTLRKTIEALGYKVDDTPVGFLALKND